MQLFYYNRGQANINPLAASLALRIGFLFADTAIITPVTQFQISVPDQKMGFGAQEQLVMDDLQKNDPDLLANMLQTSRKIKKLRSLKGKSKQTIVAIRQYEDAVGRLHQVLMEDMDKNLSRFGLSQLRDLARDPSLLTIPTDLVTPELDKHDNLPASTVFQLMPDGNPDSDHDICLMLPPEALDPELMPGISILEDADTAAIDGEDEGRCWLAPLLDLPNINALTALELQIVRTQLRRPGVDFRSAVDEWNKLALIRGEGVAAGIRHFRDKVLPAAAAIQLAMRGNTIINALAPAGSEMKGSLFAGEMPLNAVWAFGERSGMLVPETMEKLREACETRGRKRVPVFILGLSNAAQKIKDAGTAETLKVELGALRQTAEKDASTEEPVQPLSVRKSIRLD